VSSDDNSGPREGFRGVVEDLKGKAKEVAGEVTGDEDREREGRAQQDKAASQRDVARKEAEAEKSRAAAKESEIEQRVHQKAAEHDD
jgi:uncharacterized protein YjbJ (UPF0337 family)